MPPPGPLARDRTTEREEAIPLDQIKRVTVCVTYEGGEERRHTVAGGDLPAVLLRMLLALL